MPGKCSLRATQNAVLPALFVGCRPAMWSRSPQLMAHTFVGAWCESVPTGYGSWKLSTKWERPEYAAVGSMKFG